ncbi:MAG: NUDIX domain-containing protein [Acidimicrobiia bacterium]|nr:NUDIX domain-containing protein [Acidimicrobiia bacterium]
MELLPHGDPRLDHSEDLATARAAVGSTPPSDPAVEAARTFILTWTSQHVDALHRSCAEAHLTSSALVVDQHAERVLLLQHAKLRKWLQPGGHADGEANLAASALREATEESGIIGLRVVVPPIDLDIHRVEPPGEASHLHLDVRYLVLAPPDAELRANHESTGAAWATFDELGGYQPDAGLRRLAEEGLAAARRLLGR